MAAQATASADFMGLPCASFYKPKFHHATKETADRLLEKIASGNVSDIGESDDEDDVPQEDVLRENDGMIQSPSEDEEEEHKKTPLKEISAEDNIPKNFQWKKRLYVPPSDTDFSGHNECPPDAGETCTPYMYFSRYVPESVFKVIAENTNLYSVQSTLHNVNTTADEIRKLFGMHIMMGVVHLPRVRLYGNPMMKVPLISETMTEKRFFKLRNNLHIVPEDSDFHSEDRLWKVRPFLELIRKRCLELAVEEECSIDEQMIPFKGQLSIKQYVKGKPSPWGIKVFALCGRSGSLYDFAVYQGENTIPAELKKDYGLCSGVVLHLSKRIPSGCNYQLYFDNYFTSVPLLRRLRQDKILAAGTVSQNRLGKCPLE
ncbi:piggyBac transposable element-derived protein 3-like [Dermacentor albipictus]|uniref:piggyBac transposable element-derived protein 3-like n=1 Tax=Dermacentor albipictus TaxID=60249 RepID=UPI0031FCD8D9